MNQDKTSGRKWSAVLGLAVAMLFVACAAPAPVPSTARTPAPITSGTKPKPYRVGRTWYQPMNDASNFTQDGVASWYGEEFHGRRTSNGEIYDMYGVSAAHKTLPFGTYVRVENLQTGKTIDVRINDRGPFVRNRIIDLSYGAAKQLGIVGPGTARVVIMALGRASGSDNGNQVYVPDDYYTGNFTFQVGAFAEKTNAERLRQELSGRYENAHITTYNSGMATFYRVRVGKVANLDQAVAYEDMLIENGYENAFIVAE
ncbi:MAG: septal ring lytic transglycosylase RlpA family protein [Desulfobacteraceae bacterium]|nr:septal ring lytic transglycosylase RlpA family protein [Desulfobacteraceae bacterium]